MDGIVIAFGAVLIAASLTVAVASWPSDRVLIAPPRLERFAELLLIPSWVWLVGSMLMVFGIKRENLRGRWIPFPPRRQVIGGVALAATCLAVVIGGMLLGVAKGSLRVLGSTYQVSTGSLHNGVWTTVSHPAYQMWEARFLRLDALFSLFGLFMIVMGARLLAMRRSLKAGAQS